MSSSTQDVNEVMLTGQAVMSEPLTSDGHKVEGVAMSHQETVEVINSQGVSSFSSQVSEVITSQELINDQEVINNQSFSSQVSEVITSQESINDQEVINNQSFSSFTSQVSEVVTSHELINDQEVINSQMHMVNVVTTQKVVSDQGSGEQSFSQIIYSKETTEEVSSEDVSGEILDQEIDNQKVTEPSTQEVIETVNNQDDKAMADQEVTKLVNSTGQQFDEVIKSQDGDVVAEQTTGQEISKVNNNEEGIDHEVVNSQGVNETATTQVKEVVDDQADDQEVTKLASNERINRMVNDQGIGNLTSQDANSTVNIQGTGEELDTQLVFIDNQAFETDQSAMLANSQLDQSAVVLPPIDISQDTASHDIVDTPHHSKSLLEQHDIWHSSFVLTQPSCMKCPTELRSLWREPVMENKVSTQPLQHYTLSVNSDQVSCDVILCHHGGSCVC